jgi:hypothetical protein
VVKKKVALSGITADACTLKVEIAFEEEQAQ